MIIVFYIGILIFRRADPAGVIDRVIDGDLLLCDSHPLQSPSESRGSVAVFDNVRFHRNSVKDHSLLSFCRLSVIAAPIGRSRNVGQSLRQDILYIQICRDLGAIGVGFARGAQNRKIQGIVRGPLIGIHVIGKLVCSAVVSLHRFFRNLSYIGNDQTGIAMAHACCSSRISILVIFGFHVV